MGKETGIEWTDHTFNPWWGCQRVSPGCERCYAETWDRRVGGGHWGPVAPRRFFKDAHWNEPRRWDKTAAANGVRARVFCASMADVFEDRPDLVAPRARLFQLIAETPRLDWLLLTKRPQNLVAMLPWRPDPPGAGDSLSWGKPWPNVWVGTTVEDRRRATERIPVLGSAGPPRAPSAGGDVASAASSRPAPAGGAAGERRRPGVDTIPGLAYKYKP